MTTRISYANIEDVIADRLRAQSYPDKARLSSRLKQLRNIANIPKSGTTNRGPRARYGLADIVQISLVFECVQRSVATLRAAMVITTYWSTLERSVCAAWVDREKDGGDGTFALLFLEEVDGFAKRDSAIEWVKYLTVRRDAGEVVLPLVVTGRGSDLFPKGATGQFPAGVNLPPQEGATLIHLTTFVKNLVQRLDRHAVCSELEFTRYCEDVMARPDPQRDIAGS